VTISDPWRFRFMRFCALALNRFLCLPTRICLLLIALTGLLQPATASATTVTYSTGNQNFGTVNIGSSDSAILSFNVSGGSIGSVEVVTQGTPSLDFTNPGGGTCTGGTTTACTVDVTFRPIYAGLRRGAVLFWSGANNTGSVIGKTFIYGAGNGGQIIYGPPVISAVATPSGFGSWSAPEAVAFDGANDLWVLDNANNRLVEIPVAGAPSAIGPNVPGGGTLGGPLGTELDGAGDVVISDNLNQRMLILPVGGGTPISIVPGNVAGTYYSYPMGFAVDGLGNIIVPDEFNYRVIKITNPESSPTISVVGLGGKSLLWPTDVWLDAAGDLYIADFGSDPNTSTNPASNPQVLEVFPNGTSQKLATPGCTLQSPASAEADPAGNIFIGDITVTNNGQTVTGGRVIEVPAGGGNCIVTTSYTVDPALGGGNGANGPGVGMVNLNAAGDVYVSDYSNNIIIKLQRSVPPTVTFSHSTTIGTLDTTDGTKTVQITNIGNTTLDFDGLTYPTDFPVGSTSNQCTASSVIAINGTCNVAIEFFPQSGGPLNEDVTLFNNAGGGSQSIAVTGTGSGTAPSITSASSTTFTVGALGTFSVVASGTPAPTFSETGALPSGVTLSTSGLLSGTPASGTGGSYPISISASNGIGSPATQSFTLTVDQGPAITSGASTTFTVGTAGSFSATASGFPAPTFSETGTLPSGVTMSTSGLLSGTPGGGTGGTYPLTITASNGIGSPAAQTFTLTVNEAPAITSANNTTFTQGIPGTFTVAATGYPSATLSESGALPTGVTFTGGVLSGTPAGLTGSYPITITAANGVGSGATQNFTLNVNPGAATHIGLSAPGTANVGSPFNFTVIAFDQFNGIATGYTGTVTFSSTDTASGVVLPVSYTFRPGDSGVHTFPATLATPGSAQTITATDSANSFSASSGNISVSIRSLVVTTAADDAGTASNCDPATAPNASCSLRDALLEAASLGSANISFDSTAFASPTTITLASTLTVPSYTTIQGPASGAGSGLTNLVTIDGGGSGVAAPVFTTSDNVLGAVLQNLIITDGFGSLSGGIFNGYQASLTLRNCTVSANSSATGTGGIFNNYNATLVVLDSTISGNSGAVGGISTETGGSVTITNSTLAGNTSTSSGGAISNGGTSITISDSTISGNSAQFAGGGINTASGTTALANTIIAQNTASSGSDIEGAVSAGSANNLIGDGTDTTGITNGANGNLIGTAGSPLNPGLSPLSSNGGPTQTMLLLLGSPASCAGNVSQLPSGVTTDQRGFANTNTTYPGFSVGSPCVDMGAVQTNYALSFSQQPSTSNSTATFNVNIAISPAPAVSVTESGIAISGVTVTMSDSAGVLNGTKTQTSIAGTATFNDLSIGAAETNETLTATLPGLNIPTTSYPFNAVFAPPQLTSPTLSSTLPGSTATFTWDPGSATTFQFRLGTVLGANDVFSSGRTTQTSASVSGLPTNGVTLYARLYYLAGGAWQALDYTFNQSGSSTLPFLTSPAPGSTLGGATQTFTWNPGGGATQFQLWVSAVRPGDSDLYRGAPTRTLSASVSGIPTNGLYIYVRLRYELNGVWNHVDYICTEFGTPTPPTLQTPAPSSTLTGSTVTFTWDPGSATTFQFRLGTVRGSNNLYGSGQITQTSVNVNNLPTDGSPIHAILYYKVNGAWQHVDYVYTAQ
jgi:hypothetical protein